MAKCSNCERDFEAEGLEDGMCKPCTDYYLAVGKAEELRLAQEAEAVCEFCGRCSAHCSCWQDFDDPTAAVEAGLLVERRGPCDKCAAPRSEVDDFFEREHEERKQAAAARLGEKVEFERLARNQRPGEAAF